MSGRTSPRATSSFATTGRREALAAAIEDAIEAEFGFRVPVLVFPGADIERIAAAIPAEWVTDKTMRTDAWFLWPDIDEPGVIDDVAMRDGVDHVRYEPGAIIWHVRTEDIGRSWRNKITASALYQRITIRNANTVRKLATMVAD